MHSYDGAIGAYDEVVFSYTHSQGAGTYWVDVSPSNTPVKRAFRTYNAFAYLVHRLGYGIGGTAAFTALVNTSPADGSGYSHSDGYATFSNEGSDKKFIMAHEFGHRLADLYTSNAIFGDVEAGYTPCPASSGEKHSMGSKEHQSGAVNEGLAHFVAAAAWNDTNATNCSFKYYKTELGVTDATIDCEGSSTNYPVRFMELVCSIPYANYGVELDWLRTFWDVRTDGASSPSFDDVMDWIAIPGYGSSYSFYTWLDGAADTFGGSLNTNWDGAKGTNGVDWP